MKEHGNEKDATRSEKIDCTHRLQAGQRQPQVFDDEGVKMAILAALECVYECFPHITLPQYLIALKCVRPNVTASRTRSLRS
jgi:hypothetical protein